MTIVEGDMRTFRLDRWVDAVVCLISSIGYLRTEADLDRAVATMGSHLRDGAPPMTR